MSFRTILENELERRGLSLRQAAKEIGISHTTLNGARNGTRTIDTITAMKIARWIGIPLSELMGDAQVEDPERKATVQAIQIILEAVPELEQVFLDAAKELEAGTLSLGDFRELVEFAAFKIRKRREEAQADVQGAVSHQDRRRR
jgi:transcriptional regulator with XRE-family HTH domain